MTSRQKAIKAKQKRVSTTTRIKKETNRDGVKTRSGFEDKMVDVLSTLKVDYEYENKDRRISYTVPEKIRKYLCDFVVTCKSTGTEYYFEGKGYIPRGDLDTRMKYVYVNETLRRDQKLIMVFQNPNLKITKNAKQTYKEWFESKGITCLDIKQFHKILKSYKKTGKIDLSILD